MLFLLSLSFSPLSKYQDCFFSLLPFHLLLRPNLPFLDTAFATPTAIMPPFVPPEILGMILSFIFDIESLLALRLVNKVWRDAVDYFVGQPLYVDLLNKNLVRLYSATKSDRLRKRVRTLVWNLPDRPIWHVSASSLSQYAIKQNP